ncbi:Voltage-dependent T-type calcium channel subunit alpha-1G [Liparis tanakae]|uniref:Voltage-dependent T-type calcium channel subunit alpha-1G n=1 Tax=Liparis tanakae TaxID=230148 RepID=A0A4Z2HV26_9TELE|nr:Voltage-dependent T-type calcium channel subunit alpha-1G [Liparis tanakae]
MMNVCSVIISAQFADNLSEMIENQNLRRAANAAFIGELYLMLTGCLEGIRRKFRRNNRVHCEGGASGTRDSTVGGVWGPFRIWLNRVVQHKIFDRVIMLAVFLSILTMAIEHHHQPKELTYFVEISNLVFTVIFVVEMVIKLMALGFTYFKDKDNIFDFVIVIISYVFFVVFLVEMLFKVLAQGLLFGSESYCRSSWNVLDGSLVLLSLADIFVSLVSLGRNNMMGSLKVLRMLRTLRPLRVVKRAPRLKLAVEALMKSVKPIGNIFLICCAFLFFYAILGLQLFKGKFYSCRGEDLDHITNKTECLSADYLWKPKFFNFDSLPQALMSLFVMYSKDGWVSIMHDGVDAVDVDVQPVMNYNEWILIFFITFMIVSFFLLDMFIGVMVDTFFQCQQEQKRRDGAERRLLRDAGEEPVGCRRRLSARIRWNVMDLVIILVSVLSIILTKIDMADTIPINPSILRVCRVLRLAQVLKTEKIRVMLRTIIKTLSQDTMAPCRPGDEQCSKYLVFVSPVYFVSFVVMVQFVLVNLVVAVIMQAMEDSKLEEELAKEELARQQLAREKLAREKLALERPALLSPDEDVVQSDEDVVQSDEDVVQSDEDVVQSDEDVVQPFLHRNNDTKMRSLQNLLLALCMCVRSAAEVIRVSGHEGGEVHVSCPYGTGYESYEKYLCKNKCGNDDVLITTTEPNQSKYSIHDNRRKRVFTATISDLRRTDAGTYWCGVTKSGNDIYTEVDLEVGPAWCCVRSDEASGIVGRPLTVRCPYPSPHGTNRKFLCKGDHRNNCTGVATSGGRFSLRDDVPSSSFLVIITELEAGDAGTYWCGSDSQWTVGDYTNIHLSASAVSPSVVFIVPAVLVPAVLLTLTFALVMISEKQEVAHFVMRSWGPQSAGPYYDDVLDAQQESLYQNITLDDIYCN